MDRAVHRRLDEELHLQCPLRFMFKFQYQAQFDDEGAENELCSVYVGHCDALPDLNRNEVSELRYIEPDALDREMQDSPHAFTPWFRMEWARLRRDHASMLTPH